jgi:hypothetical protein
MQAYIVTSSFDLAWKTILALTSQSLRQGMKILQDFAVTTSTAPATTLLHCEHILCGFAYDSEALAFEL